MSDHWFDDYPGLAFERLDHGVLKVTINRPEVMNATDQPLHRALSTVWLAIDADEATRVVVITGQGKAFSAGGDLAWVQRSTDDHANLMSMFKEAGDIVHNMARCSKVVISAINGVAVGAGLAVALLADISLVDQDAKLSDGHLRMGVAAGDHAVILWPLLCGMAKAKYYLLTADFLDGRTADEIGLVSKALPREQLLDEALALATRIATGPQDAARLTKRALNLWLSQAAPAFDASLAFEMLNFLGPDAAEGVAALREKRRPDFPSGR